MPKVKSLDKPTMRMLREKINESLKDLGEELGIEFSAGSGSFMDKNGHFKLEMNLQNEDGEVITKEAVDLKRYAFMHGLGEDALDKEFTYGGETFKIKGYKPRARKNPIIGERTTDGGRFVFPLDAVKSLVK